MGGDATVYRQLADSQFIPVPQSIPKDLNILFLSIDAVRADRLAAYGYARKTTPVIDALAEEGALFLNAWAHAPSTRYSIPAIITGRYPSQIIWNKAMWWPGLSSDNDTMAEKLKARGLTTGALLSYNYFDPKRRMNQGFDFYDNSLAPLHQGRDPASTTGSSARELADAAIRFLEAHQEKRFFLWAHFYDPHYAWQEHPGTQNFGSEKVDLYDHEILFTDEQIGRVLARLTDLGLRDKTAIVVTADHGEGLGEHGIKMHGYHLYAAQTKVPLVMRIPGLKKRRISTPVGHVDLLPTFINLVGGKPTRTMFGRSLLAELTGQKSGDEDREVFQEVIYEGPTERRAVVTKKWHLIYNRVPDNTFELYDLERDPGEARDVSGEKDIAELKKHLLGWINTAEMPPESYAELAAAVLKKEPQPAIAIHAEFGEAIDFLGADLEHEQFAQGKS